jgi:hypothetical protein
MCIFPKMKYAPEERSEVIRQAYRGRHLPHRTIKAPPRIVKARRLRSGAPAGVPDRMEEKEAAGKIVLSSRRLFLEAQSGSGLKSVQP